MADASGVHRVDSFEEAIQGNPSLSLVDMPIGLLDEPFPGGRTCDRLARQRLRPFGHRVFSPPTRAHLKALAFSECRGISLQAWHLVPKLREVDDAVARLAQDRVREGHPELSFAAMNGGAPLPSKRTPAGLRARERLLGLREGEVGVPRGARLDDALDALALRWSAARVARGRGEVLGDGARVGRGLRMEIWF